MMHALFGLALHLASSAAPAPAPASAELNDIRCFIVAAEMADSQDKEVETAGSIMLFYFLGRLDGSRPGVNLEELIEKEAGSMAEEGKKELLATCAAKVEQRGKDLSALAD